MIVTASTVKFQTLLISYQTPVKSHPCLPLMHGTWPWPHPHPLPTSSSRHFLGHAI